MAILKKANVFLIRVDTSRKNYVPSKFPDTPGKPIFAEDVILHNRYKLDNPDHEMLAEFQRVKNGDYLIVFCSSLVPACPNQIKYIFTVASKIQNQLVLKIHTRLHRGYTLDHVRSLVEEGKLSRKMLNCEVKGFKICEVEFSDLELLVNYDPIVRTYHSSSWKT
ncbi:MAG: hypothetical protein ACFFDI_23335 [Promethearchaeota archaeon]